jgi:Domain of unknown function (DUF4359)
MLKFRHECLLVEEGVMESSWRQEAINRLSGKHIWAGIAIAVLSGLGVSLVMTNPNQLAYEAYATKQLSSYLKDTVCADAPAVFDLRKQCRLMVNSNQAEIRQFVAKNTHRQNFILFSIYTTDLSVGSFMPSYEVETIGIFHRFSILDARQDP